MAVASNKYLFRQVHKHWSTCEYSSEEVIETDTRPGRRNKIAIVSLIAGIIAVLFSLLFTSGIFIDRKWESPKPPRVVLRESNGCCCLFHSSNHRHCFSTQDQSTIFTREKNNNCWNRFGSNIPANFIFLSSCFSWTNVNERPLTYIF